MGPEHQSLSYTLTGPADAPPGTYRVFEFCDYGEPFDPFKPIVAPYAEFSYSAKQVTGT